MRRVEARVRVACVDPVLCRAAPWGASFGREISGPRETLRMILGSLDLSDRWTFVWYKLKRAVLPGRKSPFQGLRSVFFAGRNGKSAISAERVRCFPTEFPAWSGAIRNPGTQSQTDEV